MDEMDEIINKMSENFGPTSPTLKLVEIFNLFKEYKNKKYKFKLYRRAEGKIIEKIMDVSDFFIKNYLDQNLYDNDDCEIINFFNSYIRQFLALFFKEMYNKRCSHFFCRSSFKKIYKENKNCSNIVNKILLSKKISNHSVLSENVRNKLAKVTGININQDDKCSYSTNIE